jgi:hypothetical protein
MLILDTVWDTGSTQHRVRIARGTPRWGRARSGIILKTSVAGRATCGFYPLVRSHLAFLQFDRTNSWKTLVYLWAPPYR